MTTHEPPDYDQYETDYTLEGLPGLPQLVAMLLLEVVFIAGVLWLVFA